MKKYENKYVFFCCPFKRKNKHNYRFFFMSLYELVTFLETKKHNDTTDVVMMLCVLTTQCELSRKSYVCCSLHVYCPLLSELCFCHTEAFECKLKLHHIFFYTENICINNIATGFHATTPMKSVLKAIEWATKMGHHILFHVPYKTGFFL